ncbi:acyl-CoA N-acyltransferase [Cladorrhinum sp. PSN332]|nr:acyl-CoA N-acyltransferase [Cladorrhinum sp. PSN332]
MPSLTFRLATLADAVVLTSLINTSFRNDPTTDVFLSPSHEGIDVTSLPQMEAAISDPAKAIVLATTVDASNAATEKIVGHCSVRLLDGKDKGRPKTAWFGLLAVDISAQGKGVGSQLLKYAEWYARTKLGATRMEFDVVWTRKTLVDWYKARGYTEMGETRPFPYDSHAGWEGVLRGDLGFLLMGKELHGEEE